MVWLGADQKVKSSDAGGPVGAAAKGKSAARACNDVGMVPNRMVGAKNDIIVS